MTGKPFDYVEWFAAHGHTNYRDAIAKHEERIAALKGSDPECATIMYLENEINEIRQSAADKYDDLKTDPLD